MKNLFSQCFIFKISVLLSLFLIPACSVLADDIAVSLENVPDIWQCIGCPSGEVGTKMSLSEQQNNLNDLWGSKVLRQGIFPQEINESQTAIVQANNQLEEKIYLVAEGGKIPLSVASAEEERDPRLTITWKDRGLLSTLLSGTPGETTGFLQIIAWDSIKEKFNYYELNNDKGWTWGGDSGHARQPQFTGKGCFDCHHNGSVIMKELKRPWNNWQSQLTNIDLSFLPEMVRDDPNLKQLIGAEVLETDIKAGVAQDYRSWLDAHVSEDAKKITDVPELLRHLTTTTSVNFESNLANIQNLASLVSPPHNFFLFDDALAQLTGDGFDSGYNFPNTIGFDASKFQQAIANQEFALRQCNREEDTNKCASNSFDYEQQGTTFHPFFIPVPSNEDTFVIQNLTDFQVTRDNVRRDIQFVTDKFAAAILMVDFPNPVFSPVRQSLQTYAEELVEPANIDAQGVSDIPASFVAKIEAAVSQQSPCLPNQLDSCSAEQQFLHTWNLPDNDWKQSVGRRIQTYLNGVNDRIANNTGLEDYLDLSISRKRQFAAIKPIKNLFESSLLLPQNDTPSDAPILQMKSDGTVVAVN